MATKKSILLRISPELSDALTRWADDELRSVNGQIEYLLREAVRKRTGKILPSTSETADANKTDDSGQDGVTA